MHGPTRHLVPFLISTLCLTGSGELVAAETTSDVQSEARFIEEIRVTAIRRDTIEQETPVTMSVMTAMFLEQYGVRNPEDIQNYIPSLTVQPYDIAIREVGRNFRNVGGAPGAAIYLDNAYQEEFSLPASEHGLYDMERIEVLRGPQGTLYGRNTVGGAINYITNKPSHDFSAEFRSVLGSYNTRDLMGYVTGSLIRDRLSGRLVFSDRYRDGVIENISGEDINSENDTNVSLSFDFTPTDRIRVYLRANDRKLDRQHAHAKGDLGLLVAENGRFDDEISGARRNNTAEVFGLRQVDPNVACASQTDRSNPACTLPGQFVFDYNFLGQQRFAQRRVPGVDPVVGIPMPNHLLGHPADLIDRVTLGDGSTVPRLNQNDVLVDMNSPSPEIANQQALTLTIDWEVSDSVLLRYIGNSFDADFYRDSDMDHSSNQYSRGYLVLADWETNQNEFQVFADIGDNILITAGVFQYKAFTDQRVDWYTDHPYFGPADFGNDPATGVPFTPNEAAVFYFGVPGYTHDSVSLFTARDECPVVGSATGYELPFDPALEALQRQSLVAECTAFGARLAGDATDVRGGPPTPGSWFLYDTPLKTTSRAIYGELEWSFHPLASLTLGFRYGEEKKEAEENSYIANEILMIPVPGIDLLAFNVNRGALNPDGTRTSEDAIVRYTGLPIGISFYRRLENTWENTDWRVNLNYLPNDTTLVYGSITTGFRTGGFNLGFLTALPAYDKEQLISYEVGTKTMLFNDRLRLNAAAFYYDYEDIQFQAAVNQFGSLFESSQEIDIDAVSVRQVPTAQTVGLEIETLWIPTEHFEIGANYSLVDAKYTSDLINPYTGAVGTIDASNPNAPGGLYTPEERRAPLDGTALPLLPRHKFNANATYTWYTAVGTVSLAGHWSWIGEVTFGQGNRELLRAPAWDRLDLRLKWLSNDRRMDVTFFVNNAKNEVGIREINTLSESWNFPTYVTPTFPRIAGIDFRYRLGKF